MNKIRLRKNVHKFIISFLCLCIILGDLIFTPIMQISAAFMMMYSIFIIMKYKLDIKKTRYGILLSSLLLIIFVGLINSYIQYQQDIMFCIRRLSVLIASVFLYFAIYTLIRRTKLVGGDIKQIAIANGVIALFAFITQFLLRGILILPHVVYGYRRGINRMRFYFECLPVTLLCILMFDRFLQKGKKQKVIPIILVGLVLFETWYIQQYRMTTLAILCALIAGYYLSKNNMKRIAVFLFVFVVALITINTSNTIQKMWDSFINGTETFEVRALALAYYIKHLKGHWILGQGVTFPTEPLNKAALAAGYGYSIGLNDNGILGFIYCYGIIGAIWFICFWIRVLLDGYRLTKNKIFYGLMFPLYLTITLRTELHWYWAMGMINLVLFLIILECDVKEHRIESGKVQSYIKKENK